MRLRIILILLLVPFSLSAEDEQKSYLCIADKSTGFIFRESSKSWEATTFTVNDAKYIVRPTKESDGTYFSSRYMYGIWKVGSKTDRIGCEMEFTEYGWLNCGAGDGFQMNSDTLRYMFFFNGTYMTATIDTSKSEIGDTIVLKEDRGGDTPYVEIGKCSEI